MAGLGLEWLFGCRLLSLEPFGNSESKPMRRPSKDVPLNSGGRESGHAREVSDPSLLRVSFGTKKCDSTMGGTSDLKKQLTLYAIRPAESACE